MTKSDLYEDRVPLVGFAIPDIGTQFQLAADLHLGSETRFVVPAGTGGEVVCIREPLKPCHGYVGCGVTLNDERFRRLYPASMIVPWDEISDVSRFVFLPPNVQGNLAAVGDFQSITRADRRSG